MGGHSAVATPDPDSTRASASPRLAVKLVTTALIHTAPPSSAPSTADAAPIIRHWPADPSASENSDRPMTAGTMPSSAIRRGPMRSTSGPMMKDRANAASECMVKADMNCARPQPNSSVTTGMNTPAL